MCRAMLSKTETTTSSLSVDPMPSSTEVCIRALNPDDDSEIRQLCELYGKAFIEGPDGTQVREGAPYPFTQVDSPDFWRNHAGQRFLSATIRNGRTIIGHVGLRTDEFQPNVVELLFPVLSLKEAEAFGSLAALLSAVRSGFEQFLSIQAERKGWDWVVSYLPASVPGVVELAWKGFGLIETAVMPLHRSASAAPSPERAPTLPDAVGDYSGDVVCFVRSAQPRASREASPLLGLIAPERHSELAHWLSAKFGDNLSGDRLSGDRHAANGNLQKQKTSNAESASGPAFESRMSRRLAARITTVLPNRLTSNQVLTQQLGADKTFPHLVSVEASSVTSRSVCALMEELGFRFAGFLPFYRGAAHCVFAMHSPSNERFVISSELMEESILARYLDRSGGGEKALGDACKPGEIPFPPKSGRSPSQRSPSPRSPSPRNPSLPRPTIA